MGQIGTIKLETLNSGTVSVPVFSVGDSGNNVYEMIRIQTENGEGFIPVINPSQAQYPYLRVQTQNQGMVAVHNSASTTTFVDNFEDGDIDEYNGGYPGYFSTVTTPVHEGSYALKGGGSGPNKWITSTSGLGNYPSRGDKFSVWIRGGNYNSQPRTCFGLQSSGFDSGYAFNADFRDGNVAIFKGKSRKSYSSISWSANKWYRMECEWGFDTITVRVYADGSQVASTSYTDSSYDSGGIGFRADHKSDPYWDQLYIH
jgi:hypothetical protein